MDGMWAHTVCNSSIFPSNEQEKYWGVLVLDISTARNKIKTRGVFIYRVILISNLELGEDYERSKLHSYPSWYDGDYCERGTKYVYYGNDQQWVWIICYRSSQMVVFTAWKILRGYVHNTKQISLYHFQGEIVDGGVDGDGGKPQG